MGVIILFDVDGTLIKDTKAHKTAFSRTFKEMFNVNTSIDIIDHHGMTDQQIIIETMKKAGIPQVNILKNITECIQKMVFHFKKELENEDVQLLPGTEELLKSLQKLRIKMGLATGNIKEIAEEKLKKASIYQYFSSGGFGSDAIKRTEIVKKAIERAQKITGKIPSKNIFLIGDTIHDINAGKEAGINCIAVTTGSYKAEELKDADITINSFKEKDRLIDFIMNRAEIL